jgi:hypothetical protein
MTLSHLDLAHRYLGIHEKAGDQDHPLIVWWLSLCGIAGHDEIAWCSARLSTVSRGSSGCRGRSRRRLARG